MRTSFVIPDELHASLEELARENDRSVSAELRRAVAEYLRFQLLLSGRRGARSEPVFLPVAGSAVWSRHERARRHRVARGRTRARRAGTRAACRERLDRPARRLMRQEPLPPDASDEEIESTLVVVLAGAEAERLRTGRSCPERNSDDPWLSDGELAAIAAEDSSGDRVSDEDVIARFAERIGEEAIERAREFAAELVLRYAALGRLEQLADEILFRSHLTGDDLDRLLGAPA